MSSVPSVKRSTHTRWADMWEEHKTLAGSEKWYQYGADDERYAERHLVKEEEEERADEANEQRVDHRAAHQTRWKKVIKDKREEEQEAEERNVEEGNVDSCGHGYGWAVFHVKQEILCDGWCEMMLHKRQRVFQCRRCLVVLCRKCKKFLKRRVDGKDDEV